MFLNVTNQIWHELYAARILANDTRPNECEEIVVDYVGENEEHIDFNEDRMIPHRA